MALIGSPFTFVTVLAMPMVFFDWVSADVSCHSSDIFVDIFFGFTFNNVKLAHTLFVWPVARGCSWRSSKNDATIPEHITYHFYNLSR
jgi:hypothetical protein